MKALALVVVLGCGGDPLKHDVEMFCTATVGTTWKTFVDVAPYAAEHAKSAEFKELLRKPMQVADMMMDIWTFEIEVRALMKKTGVETCKTLDVIVPRRE